MSSLQLRLFRIAIRAGAPIETAAADNGIGMDEARLIVADDKRDPPRPEAYELPSKGHNMDANNDELRALIERVERLKEEQRGIGEDIRDVMAEAKSRGYDAAAIREMLRLRRMDADKRRDFQNAVEVYGTQLGLF